MAIQNNSSDSSKEQRITLEEFARVPSERARIAALILLLTLCAGWADMLAFLYLGKVFSSFLTGDLLFIGLGSAQYLSGSMALLPRALVAVLVYLGLATWVGYYLQRGVPRRPAAVWNKIIANALIAEWIFLLAYGVLWYLSSSSHSVSTVPNLTQIVLLGFAAVAMGIQGAIVQSFNIPGIVANALTGSVITLGWRLGQVANQPEAASFEWKRRNILRVLSFVLYIVAAFVVDVTSKHLFSPAAPVILITIAFIPLFLPSRKVPTELNRPGETPTHQTV